MGQKANTLTLRKNNESLNFVSLNAKEFTNALEFIKVFKRSLDKKGVVITKSDFNSVANTSYLVMNLFYKTQKLAKYKKKALKNKLSLLRLQNKKDSFLNRTKKAKVSSKRLRP
jgi:tRNA G46 methylase TrmB